MIDSFVFQAELRVPEGSLNSTCIFLPYPHTSMAQVRGILQHYLDVEGRVPPDVILFLGTAALAEFIATLCTSSTIQNCLPEITRRSSPPPVRGIYMEASGLFVPATRESEPFAGPDCIFEIRQAGLLAMVRTHEIVLSGNDRFHFVKPAGTHCASFIRAANAFVSGAATSFAALWLIEHITDKTRCVYTDTAGINAFVLSALSLRSQMNPGQPAPIVDSFGSYSGLKNYEFRYASQSLFVISSSTSCGLEESLAKQLRISDSQIVTVFFLDSGVRRSPSVVLCDVSTEYARRVREFASYEPERCPLCRSHVPAVAIGGDQFLLDLSAPEPVVLKADDAPEWLGRLTRDFVGKRVFKVHRVVQSGTRPREIFIDLERVFAIPAKGEPHSFEDTAYYRSLKRRLETHIPASLQHIVYVGDGGSRALAQRVLNWFPESKRLAISVTARSDVPKSDIRSTPLSKGTLLVIAGIVISGQSMMEINQLLRDREDDTVIYLAGLTRARDKKRLDELTGNIQYGRDGGRHYTFTSLRDIFLPDNHIERPSPWDMEAATWTAIRESLLRSPDAADVRNWCSDRIKYLKEGQSKGLEGKLFLPDSRGDELRLRQGFALWPAIVYEDGAYSQSDVYFTVVATLHNWRSRHASAREGGRNRILLAPRVFFRFNDGIIQAALLRGTNVGELDFRTNSELSQAMVEVVSVVFSHWGDTQGEAALEFLLALKEGRIVLQKEMLSGLLWELEDRVEQSTDLTAKIARVLAAAILQDLEDGSSLTDRSRRATVKGKRTGPSRRLRGPRKTV